MVITPTNAGRKLQDDIKRVLIISHRNYGTKMSIPLINKQGGLLRAKDNLIINFNSNIYAQVEFELEFLNGKYNTNFG